MEGPCVRRQSGGRWCSKKEVVRGVPGRRESKRTGWVGNRGNRSHKAPD